MKKLAAAVFVFVIVGTAFGAMYITQNCGLVSGALNELKFEQRPRESKMVGGPQQFRVTEATIDYLEHLRKDNKTVEVQNDGSLEIK